MQGDKDILIECLFIAPKFYNRWSKFINDDSVELADMAVSKGILSEDNFNKLKVQESGQSIVSIMFERAVMDEFSLLVCRRVMD